VLEKVHIPRAHEKNTNSAVPAEWLKVGCTAVLEKVHIPRTHEKNTNSAVPAEWLKVGCTAPVNLA